MVKAMCFESINWAHGRLIFYSMPKELHLSDGIIISFLNFMKFIEAYAPFFGTGSIFKHFNLTHHKVVFYLGMGEREEIIFLYHECFQIFFKKSYSLL